MPEIRIKQFDFSRIVRSELLPYEIPYRFSYDILAEANNLLVKPLAGLMSQIDGSNRIKPIQFEIAKNPLTEEVRTLTIPPPSCIEGWQDFYKHYHQVILSLCNKSSWSIRRPCDVAKVFFYKSADWHIDDETGEDHLGEKTSANLAPQDESKNQAAISSFFIYSRYVSLSQFFNSGDLKELEKTYSRCDHLDIANCFNSIYSHSIAWATRGKAEAKATFAKRGTFDSDFDFLMRSSNYGETAGIPVGPEVCRIFAEIILQTCDVAIKNRLSLDGLSDGSDYTIRRYMDDYFVFTNHKHHSDTIARAIRSEIFLFNLHLNNAKSRPLERPFVSSLSICKKKISALISEYFPPLQENHPYSQHIAQRRASKFFDEIRHIASEHSESFKPLVPFVLGALKNIATAALKDGKRSMYIDASLNRLIEILCLTEELMSVSLNYRTSVLLAEIILNISTQVLQITSPHALTLSAFSISIVDRILTRSISSPPLCRADFFTILLAARDLECPVTIKFTDFIRAARTNTELKDLTCIDLCVAIYYYGGVSGHEHTTAEILNIGINRIIQSPSLAGDAGLCCLAFDLVACPHVKSSDKQLLIRAIDPARNLNSNFWGRFQQQDAFFNWRSDKSPGALLQKKSLSSGY